MLSFPDSATTVPVKSLPTSEGDLRFFTHNENKLRQVARVGEIAEKYAEIMTYTRHISTCGEIVQLMQRTLAGQTDLQVAVYEIPLGFKPKTGEIPYQIDGSRQSFRAVYFEDGEGNLLTAEDNEVIIVPERLYDHALTAYDIPEGLRAIAVPSFDIKETDPSNLSAGIIGLTVYIDHSKP